MHLTSRLCASLIVSVAAVSLALAYFQIKAGTRGLRNELQRHALVIGESLTRAAEPLVANRSLHDLQRLVDRAKDRQQLEGVAVYGTSGELLSISPGLAQSLGDQKPPAVMKTLDSGLQRVELLDVNGSLMQVAALPLRMDEVQLGVMAIFHDARFIRQQALTEWRRALMMVAVQTILIVGITLLAVRIEFSGPLRRMTEWLHELRTGTAESGMRLPEREAFQPLTQEVTRLASSLLAARAAAEEEARLRETADSNWTAERLRIFVQTRLNGDRLFSVSNREPYEHVRRGSAIDCIVPASGLVTALEPVLRACDGTWIAQATGDADKDAVDQFGRVRVPPDHPQYTLRRVWLTEDEQRGFYLGFANEGLWPLCHIAHTRPIFRAEDWETYQAVNRKFADALLEEIEHEESPVVLVQDYHFALLPRMIKEQRRDARVAIFWHIPWPNSETFGICPWQRELLDGLLGADIIGLHVQAHCNNLLDTVDRALESRIDWARFSVTRGGQHTLVRPYPISVAMSNSDVSRPDSDLPHLERAALLARHGVRSAFMGVGVDRIDYTKGIPERFRGIETFFERFPCYRGELTFVQIGSPSRTNISRYHDLMDEVVHEAERINLRFQTSDWKPMILLTRQHSHAEILPYYRTADFCMVSSLHDGMNLVAKEFVAAREDNHGVLILSRFTGASHELGDALAVNPYDTEELANAIYRALKMAPEECRIRMQRMRASVRERNIYRWAGGLIGDLCEIRTPGAERKSAEMKPVLVRAITARS